MHSLVVDVVVAAAVVVVARSARRVSDASFVSFVRVQPELEGSHSGGARTHPGERWKEVKDLMEEGTNRTVNACI
jgi:hypothetical protein